MSQDLLNRSHPILAIHGSASNGGLWHKLAQEHAARRKVYAPDLAGYGEYDSRVSKLDSTLQMRAEPLVQWIQALGDEVHLAAHSFGASVAMEILRVIPERVKSVVFYEPVVPALLRDSGRTEDMSLLGDLVALSEIVKGTASAVGMESFIDFWSEPQAWQKLSVQVQDKLMELAPVVYQDFIEAYLNLAPDAFKQISFQGPIKIILGANANQHARRMANLLIEQFPQTHTEVLKGMGHMGPLTHPSVVHLSIMKHVVGVETHSSAMPLCAQS